MANQPSDEDNGFVEETKTTEEQKVIDDSVNDELGFTLAIKALTKISEEDQLTLFSIVQIIELPLIFLCLLHQNAVLHQ